MIGKVGGYFRVCQWKVHACDESGCTQYSITNIEKGGILDIVHSSVHVCGLTWMDVCWGVDLCGVWSSRVGLLLTTRPNLDHYWMVFVVSG